MERKNAACAVKSGAPVNRMNEWTANYIYILFLTIPLNIEIRGNKIDDSKHAIVKMAFIFPRASFVFRKCILRWWMSVQHSPNYIYISTDNRAWAFRLLFIGRGKNRMMYSRSPHRLSFIYIITVDAWHKLTDWVRPLHIFIVLKERRKKLAPNEYIKYERIVLCICVFYAPEVLMCEYVY